MILVITHKGFHPGFKLFELSDSINLKDKNEWRKLPLIKRLKIASQYKTIHYFWGRVDFLEMLFLQILGRKVILHFIGSDVLMILKSKSKQLKTKLYKLLGAKILVVHKNLAEELQSIGIESKVVEFVNHKVEKIHEVIPGEFSILVYIPEGKEDFYNLEVIEETAKLFPEIKFNIFPYGDNFSLSNLIPIKPVEHNKVIDLINSHRLFIRIPKHDGLPNTVIEALMCSRYVVWSYEHPYVYKADNVKEISEIINEVKNKNVLNAEGKKYVLEHYNTESMKNKFKEIWQLN
jgi:glycosyltransferase involved in cell wall biosynthesis